MQHRNRHKTIRAKNALLQYCGICGLLSALGLIPIVFMIILCLRAGAAGTTDMFLLLDGVLCVLAILLLLTALWMGRLCRMPLSSAQAAVAHPEDGCIGLEYSRNGKHYVLSLPSNAEVWRAGMVCLWFDPAHPRMIFLEHKPEKPPTLALAALAALLVSGGLLNLIFFLAL